MAAARLLIAHWPDSGEIISSASRALSDAYQNHDSATKCLGARNLAYKHKRSHLTPHTRRPNPKLGKNRSTAHALTCTYSQTRIEIDTHTE
jgi:hypothetical protein